MIVPLCQQLEVVTLVIQFIVQFQKRLYVETAILNYVNVLCLLMPALGNCLNHNR